MRRSYIVPVFGVFLALLLGCALGIARNVQHSYRTVVLDVPTGVHGAVYKDLGGDGSYNYDANHPALHTFSGKTSLKLKIAEYDVVLNDPQKEYANPVTKIAVDSNTSRVSIAPAYTNDKLASLLPSVRNQALNSIYSSIALLQQNYTVSDEHLYGLGDWYGVVFTPNDPAIYDTVRMIAHKSSDGWKPAIDKPWISIGTPSHPGVPSSIIEAVDQL